MAFGKVIEKLIVTLQANDAAFKKDLDRSARDAQSWGKNVQRQFATAAKVGAAGMAAMATAAAYTFNETRQLIDEQAKLARVSNVSVREFQQGAFAVKTLGVEQEKYADILKDVNDRIGDFVATGGGPMKDFFENIAPKVGVTAEQFRNLSGKDALQLYVTSLEKANLNQQDMTFYMEAMASDSTKLLPLFRENGKAMGEMADQADRLGLTMSAVDAAQVEAANDALTRAGAVAEGWAKRLTVELAPAVQAVADLYVEAALQANGYADTAAIVGDIAEAAIGGIGDTWEDISLGIIQSRAQLANFLADAIEIAQKLQASGLTKLFGLGALTEGLANSGDPQIWREMGEGYAAEFEAGFSDRAKNGSFSKRFAKQLEANRKKLQEQIDEAANRPSGVSVDVGALPVIDKAALKEQERQLSSVENLLRSLREPLQVYADDVRVIDSLLAAGKLSQQEYNSALEEYQRRLNETTPEFEAFNEAQKEAKSIIAANKTELEKLNEELERARGLAASGELPQDEFEKFEKRIGEAKERLKDANSELTVFAEQAARNIQDALGDTILASMNGTTDGLLDMWSNMLKQMVAEAIAAQIGEALGLENLLSGGKSGESGLIQKGLDLLSFDGGGFTGDGTRSGGLDGRGGFLAMVHPNETVVDHTKGQQLGPANNITINYRGSGDRREDKSAAGAMARDINRMVQAGRRYS